MKFTLSGGGAISPDVQVQGLVVKLMQERLEGAWNGRSGSAQRLDARSFRVMVRDTDFTDLFTPTEDLRRPVAAPCGSGALHTHVSIPLPNNFNFI